MKTTRRQFMIMSAAGAATLALNSKVQAQAMVSATDPQAVALGYNPDATKVDKAKFAKYAATSLRQLRSVSRRCWLCCWWLCLVCW